MFALNMRFLLGLIVFLLLAFVLVLGTWTGVKALLWRQRRKRGQAEERRRKFRPDGQPYPPQAPGICGKCGLASDAVYHLPDGTRLCPTCYQNTPSI